MGSIKGATPFITAFSWVAMDKSFMIIATEVKIVWLCVLAGDKALWARWTSLDVPLLATIACCKRAAEAANNPLMFRIHGRILNLTQLLFEFLQHFAAVSFWILVGIMALSLSFTWIGTSFRYLFYWLPFYDGGRYRVQHLWCINKII